MKTEKRIIGTTDYSRERIESNDCRWAFGSTAKEFLWKIRHYEAHGYEVKFETSLMRKIFCMGIYKVVAYKKEEKDSTHCPLCNSLRIERTTFSEYSYCCLECDGYWAN